MKKTTLLASASAALLVSTIGCASAPAKTEAAAAATTAKAGDHSCGAGMGKEGCCGADMTKPAAGCCGASHKEGTEGSCGEGSCGAPKPK